MTEYQNLSSTPSVSYRARVGRHLMSVRSWLAERGVIRKEIASIPLPVRSEIGVAVTLSGV